MAGGHRGSESTEGQADITGNMKAALRCRHAETDNDRQTSHHQGNDQYEVRPSAKKVQASRQNWKHMQQFNLLKGRISETTDAGCAT